MVHIVRGAAVAFAIALAATSVGQPEAGAAPVSTDPPPVSTHLFGQYNICGIMCNDKEDTIAGPLADWAWAERLDFISFNEICEHQTEAVIAALRWKHSQTFHYLHTTTKFVSGCALGNTIMWSARINGPAAGFGQTLTTAAGSPTRHIMCAYLDDVIPPPAIQACTVHVGFDAMQARQIDQVEDHVASGRQWGRRTLIGGDFNVEPTHVNINPMYTPLHSPPGTGQTDEANGCRCGFTTFDSDTGVQSQIDFVFMTAEWRRYRAKVDRVQGSSRNGLSDHKYLVAEMERLVG